MRISDWSSDVCSSDLPAVVLARDFQDAEAAEVGRGELRVEQPEAALAQAQHELGEGDLAGVGRPAEHRLAEEGGAQRDAVEATPQHPVPPALHAVRAAHVEDRKSTRLNSSH